MGDRKSKYSERYCLAMLKEHGYRRSDDPELREMDPTLALNEIKKIGKGSHCYWFNPVHMKLCQHPNLENILDEHNRNQPRNKQLSLPKFPGRINNGNFAAGVWEQAFKAMEDCTAIATLIEMHDRAVATHAQQRSAMSDARRLRDSWTKAVKNAHKAGVPHAAPAMTAEIQQAFHTITALPHGGSQRKLSQAH